MGSEFLPLNGNLIDLLAQNEQLYHSYVDALGLLQDLVAPYSAARSHQTFNEEYIKKHLDYILKDTTDIDPSNSISKNIKQNLATAFEIHRQAEKITSVASAHEVQTNVDKFIDDLTQMYGLLRIRRKGRKVVIV